MIVMVDMDQTLIHSIDQSHKNFDSYKGIVLEYSNHKIKVFIRPGAIEMVKTIVEYGHNYIIWSAGVSSYVNEVMRYFNKKSGVIPEKIYTREDMINEYGKYYKSMKSKGYDLDRVIIIDDNPNLIHPIERDRIINISPWFQHSNHCLDTKYIIEYFKLLPRNFYRLVQ